MILYDKKRDNNKWREIRMLLYRNIRSNRLWLSLVLFLALIVYTVLTISAGAVLHKSGAVGGVIIPALHTRLSMIPNYVSGMFLARPEELAIDIKQMDYEKLAYKREMALQKQFLIASSDDYVPAQIRYRGETVPVKMRLKGDMVDHLRWKKWSFRIRVKGDHALFGMKVFSIQHPKTRNYVYEWLFHETLGRAGLVALRYDFVHVTINGKPMGIYALEEHFSKELIEHSRYREGPILRFNEDLYWAQSSQLSKLPGRLAAQNAGHYLASAIEPFQRSKVLEDPTQRMQFEYAAKLLEGFRQGKIATHELFDIKKLANYLAIIELMGTTEWTLDWTDQRFYYNPITARLEPIGFDGHIGYPNYELMGASVFTAPEDAPTDSISMLPSLLFRDPIFYKEYIQALERVSQPAYLDSLFADVDKDLKAKLRILYREYPYFNFSKAVFYQNQEFIRKMLDPVKGLHAYYDRCEETPQGGRLILQVGNIQALPIEVTSGVYQGNTLLGTEGGEVLVPARGEDLPVRYTQVVLVLPPGLIWSDDEIQNIRLNYRVLGASTEKQIAIYPWKYQSLPIVQNDLLRQPAELEKNPFLQVKGRDIVARPGRWTIRKPLIIPEGFVFHVREGTEFDLAENAFILSYSPVRFIGTEESPIVIHSSSGTGQGFAVLTAKDTSVLRYVRFENLDVPSYDSWQLTGAVTFYESPVQIGYSQFLSARAEDALNIVRSEFQIVDSLFNQTASDALDVDFGTGRLARVSFVECGNDALDFSGSVVQVQECSIQRVGDKGISAGEASRVEVSHATIDGVKIALASKDQSELIVDDVKIRNAEVGLAVFQKKPEFGPATLTASNLEIADTRESYLVEILSLAHVNGNDIVGRAKNVADRFYGAATIQTTQTLLQGKDGRPPREMEKTLDERTNLSF